MLCLRYCSEMSYNPRCWRYHRTGIRRCFFHQDSNPPESFIYSLGRHFYSPVSEQYFHAR
jgi:hypothetical protein